MLRFLRGRLRPMLLRSKRHLGFDGGTSSNWLDGVFCEPRSGSNRARHEQREMPYRLYLPAGVGHSDRVPLIVMLHGCTQSALTFSEGTRMNTVAEDEQCAVLYPEQSKKFNYLRCWNWFDPDCLAGGGELGLIVRTLDHVIKHHPIDQTRVYAAGFSAGGAMAAALCATHGHLFAACAIHSGVMFHAASAPSQAIRVLRSGSTESPEDIARKVAARRDPGAAFVPTLVIQGADDRNVSPVNAEQIVQQLRLLAELVQSEDGPVKPQSERLLESGGRQYRQQDYAQGARTLIRSILVDGLGHAWSGGDARHRFFDSAGPDASRLIIEFLMQYRLANAPETMESDQSPAAAAAS
jgi:poly(hydroxyalkanoate) depolymerase family esterase